MKVSFLKLKTVPGHTAFVRVPGNEHVAVYHITGQRGSWTLDYSPHGARVPVQEIATLTLLADAQRHAQVHHDVLVLQHRNIQAAS